MNIQANTYTDIDYEHMDDLPLSDHIEWDFLQTEKVMPADLGCDQLDLFEILSE